MDTALLDQVIQACTSQPLTDAVLGQVLVGQARADFCDAFSRRVAHEYAAGRLSFEVADAAVNRLYFYGFHGEGNVFPEYSWDVYLAFDDGEWHRPGDPDTTDPELKYTRPQIIEIVARDLYGQRT